MPNPPEFPRDYIKRLVKTVTDDATIAEMFREKFGNQVTPERVKQIREGRI